MLNALTIDVEEYFQVSAFEGVVPRTEWDAWPSRVEAHTELVLELLADAGVQGTFFTLGWVAQRFPALVRRIVAAGHELACHGMSHVRATAQDRRAFRDDVTRARASLEDVAGVAVTGYRAASFSIDGSNLWALEELAAAGFRYSSSIYPVAHDHYGMPEAPRFAHRPAVAPQLLEVPVTTVRALGRTWPAGGGGWFRLYPYALSRALIRRVNERERRPAVFYTHPWEFDPAQPRPAGLPVRTRFRHYVNQHRMRERFRRLLADFRWAPVREVFAAELGAEAR